MMIYHASLAVLWLVLGYWPAGTSFSRKWRNSIGIPRGESCRARQGKKTMAEATAVVDRKSISSFKKWFLEGQVKEVEGPHEKEGQHHTHSWWQVMCLTGVDYFSTLGYQPSIAFVVATDFIITITLSAADATAHIVDNPFAPPFLHDHRVAVTLLLVSVLGGVFLKGFKEAIGLAVLLVASYLLLNLVIVGVGMYEILIHPQTLSAWKNAMFSMPEVKGNPLLMIGLSLILFPKLALGLSGFETGVAVMPLVKGDPGDDPKRPAGRIRNTRRLLLSAALIMSFMLISSSLVTTMLIPAEEFRPATATQKGGEADGRALSYLAHHFLGDYFGTAYDVSTILILWFAGASAMAGLINIVPRYLPRYGMAPNWTRATRPLVLVYTAIAFAVTIIFDADHNAQGGAYATGVLVLMTSAAVAVTMSTWRDGAVRYAFLAISLVFGYTLVTNII